MADSTQGERSAADRELLERFAETRDAADKDALVERFTPLAVYFANRYRNRGVSTEDLRQVSMVGLLNALDRFDPGRGVSFSTFAGRTIDGELKRHLRDHGWSVRVPRSLKERNLELRRSIAELEQALGRVPSTREVADHCGMDVDEVLDGLDAGSAYRADSLSVPAGQDAPDPVPGVLEPGFGQTVAEATVESLLETLDERDRRVVELRYYEDLSQSEIAERVGVSQMQISRILRRTLLELRSAAE